MLTLNLPVLQGLNYSYSLPDDTKIEFEQSSKFDFFSGRLRDIPDLTVTINGYIPKAYFLDLDNFFIDYDGKSFIWNNLIWLCPSIEITYLTDGSTGNINMKLIRVTN